MNIVRKIHDQFRVKTVAGAQLETPSAVSYSGGSGSTYITIAGGSLNGSSLSEEDRNKLNSIEQGAQVNQDAFAKISLEATSVRQEEQATTTSSIIANIPSDTANIKLIGNYPISLNLESVSLFNYNTVTTAGDIVAEYNIYYDEEGNIVLQYSSGAIFNTNDIELIRIQHRNEILAQYDKTQFTYSESDGTITRFVIPYQNTNFSSIVFCKYQTTNEETGEGTQTERELVIQAELSVSPTKQSIITISSNSEQSYWNYQEDENGNKYLWTDCNVYSTKEVTAYGKPEADENIIVKNLYELQDVQLNNLLDRQVLVYDATNKKWINVNSNTLGVSADNLKTLTVTVNGTTYTYNPGLSNQVININTITLDDVTEYISGKLDKEDFFKWFTIIYDEEGNIESIQANFDFYSVGELSAYGLGDLSNKTYTTLAQMDDVSISDSLVINDMLVYNGTKWVNVPMSQVKGVTRWSDLEDKPTTLAQLGITDIYTKTEVDTKVTEVSSRVDTLQTSKADSSIQIIAGSGLAGGGNLQQDITLSLEELNNSGTYYKVTVDSYGRVTAGTTELTIDDIVDLQNQLDSKLNISDFNVWFTINYNEDGTVKNICANYDLYSLGEITAYNVNDEDRKTYTTLAELDDILFNDLVVNDVLVYNGTKWVNVPQSEIKGAQNWSDLQNKPTTLSGFGIVDAYTKTEVDTLVLQVSNKLDDFLTGTDTDDIINKWKELEAFLAGYTETQTLADLLSIKANSSITITAGTGLTGGGDLTQNRTISLATSGVTTGTYTKVTVDTYGRVTSGGTLTTTDIPDLDWSKITTGKPTTLEGYGITDGVNNIVLNGDGNAITGASINNHILTLTKGATFLLQSTFDDMFEKVNIGTESKPQYVIKAKYGFYSVGEITAYGLNDDGKTTYTTLAELDDVLISNLAIDNLLKYDGTKWVNIPMSQMVVDAYTKSEMDNKLATITNIVEDVQRQTNRQVTFWFFEYDPTTTNYPASEWTTNEEKLKHEEDMFYNSTSGKVWRWKLNNSSKYEWSLITDADTLRALELVEIAQNTANQKKRNFTTTPTKDDAYDVGDLWSNATYGTSYDNDLLVCITAKTAGSNFSISHWKSVGKVTSSYISSQINTINNSINKLDTRVKTVETNVSTAQSTANAAKTAASNAQSAADTAQSTADTAKTNAATAQSTANAAQSTANSAQSTANSALTKANANESTLTTITSEAPSDLNTFKKLAAAINNDANYHKTVNDKIASEVSTLNSRIDTEVKKLQDQLDTIFSWFAFENSCIKAKHSLFSVGELTAYKTS